jgi:hypothetical protein
MLKVKIIDENHEKDLESSVNAFLSSVNGKVIEVQFRTSVAVFADEQLYCFSAMILYDEK